MLASSPPPADDHCKAKQRKRKPDGEEAVQSRKSILRGSLGKTRWRKPLSSVGSQSVSRSLRSVWKGAVLSLCVTTSEENSLVSPQNTASQPDQSTIYRNRARSIALPIREEHKAWYGRADDAVEYPPPPTMFK